MSATQQEKKDTKNRPLELETLSDLESNEDQYNNKHRNKRKCKADQFYHQNTSLDSQILENNKKNGNPSLTPSKSTMTSFGKQQTEIGNISLDSLTPDMEIFLQFETTINTN
jgi:hypothetical protein